MALDDGAQAGSVEGAGEAGTAAPQVPPRWSGSWKRREVGERGSGTPAGHSDSGVQRAFRPQRQRAGAERSFLNGRKVKCSTWGHTVSAKRRERGHFLKESGHHKTEKGKNVGRIS